jgi:hypothetical protein
MLMNAMYTKVMAVMKIAACFKFPLKIDNPAKEKT